MFAFRRVWLIGFALLFSLMLPGQSATAAVFSVGDMYSLTGVNFPVDFSTSVTLDGTTKPLVDGLTVREVITPVGPGSAWVEFVFESTGPLASDFDSLWRIDINDIPVTGPAFRDARFIYWTVDGVAVDPIVPTTDFNPVLPNPINPALGPAYVRNDSTGPFASLDAFVFVDPYSFLAGTGVDPNLANGFHYGVLGTLTTIPEPSSFALLGLTAAGYCGVRIRRRRKQQRA